MLAVVEAFCHLLCLPSVRLVPLKVGYHSFFEFLKGGSVLAFSM